VIRFEQKLLLGAALASLVTLGTSCDKGGPDLDARKTQEDAAETKKARADIERDVDTLSKALTGAPLDYERTLADCEKFGARARAGGFKDIVTKIDGIKSNAKAAYDAAADKELKDAAEKVRSYLAAGDMDKAKNRVRGIHKALWKDDAYLARVDEVVLTLKRGERAEAYYSKITKAKSESYKQRGDPERAKGVLEAFLAIPSFSASPRKKEVEAAIAALAPDLAKAKVSKEAESTIKLQPAFNGTDDDLAKNWEVSNSDNWVLADKILTFKHNSDQPSVSMRCGFDDWEDYNVSISFRNLDGEAYVNFHGVLEGDEEKHWAFKAGVHLTPFEFKDKDRWYTLKVEVRGKEITWTPLGSSVPVTKKLGAEKGPFEIRFPKPGNSMQIKSVWVKVLKPENAQKLGG